MCLFIEIVKGGGGVVAVADLKLSRRKAKISGVLSYWNGSLPEAPKFRLRSIIFC